MKKYIALILVVCLTLSFCACSVKETGSEYSSSGQETLTLPLVTADTVELYYSQTENDVVSEVNSICVGDGKVAGIETDTVEVVDDSVEKERTVKINGENIEIAYQKTKMASSGKNDVFNQSFDFYKSDNEKVEFFHNTDKIAQYFRVGRNNTSSDKYTEFSQEELKKMSEEIILGFINQDELSKYTFKRATYDDYLNYWDIVYERNVHEYTTDNYIWVWLRNDGSLKMYQVRELGKYDCINESITKEHIDAAAVAAETKLKELNLTDLEIKAKTLCTNTDGELFVEIAYKYKDKNDLETLEKIYAKVG